MKRKTKRFSALLLAAAMAFGLSMSAFAETATPETALPSVQATAQQAAGRIADQPEAVAGVSVVRRGEGTVQVLLNQNYDDFQEALNTIETLQVDKSNDGADGSVHYDVSIALASDISGSFSVPAYTSNVGSLPTMYFDGHTINVKEGTVLTLEKGAKLYIRDENNYGGIDAGSYPAIRVEDTSQTSLWINGGNYISHGSEIISMDAAYAGLVQVQAGLFNQKLPDYMICPNNEDLSYRQVYKDSYWEVESYETPAPAGAAAKVGSDTYDTLQAAVDAANGSTVTLLQDVTESVVVPDSSSSFTFDLNGYTLKEESGKGYAIRCNNGNSYFQDSSADKTGAVYGTVDFANTKDALNFIRGGNFHATTGPAIITAGGVTVSGGSFYGAANQPVLDTHEGSKTPGYCFMGGSEIRAGEGGKIFDGFDGLTEWNFILTNYCSSENTKFYGDLGISAARIEGGYFDRQVPANLLEEGYTQRQENGMWRVIRDTGNDAATVTGEDGTNDSVDTLGNALRHAAQLSAENNATYTVTLKRDVTENAIASWYTDDANARKSKIELDLAGHTLTAKSADAAALSASGVEIFLRGNEGTINGRVESDSYLWIIHTTVNALEGQPAIANLSKDNDSLSIKGTSVINGAAGQAVIVSNGKTTIGDGSKVVAGKGGVLFQKGEAPAEVCFVLDYCTLYGDLGDADTLGTIQVNASNGKCFTKFDREPSLKVPGYVTAKGSDGLYTYVTAPVSAMVGSKEFQTLQEAIDYAAANGGTPKMIKSLTEDITTAGTMTIDMNGCTLTGNVTAGGTLNLKNGSVNGKVALGSGAALNFTNYNGLDNATLPDGYTLSAVMNADGYYSVVPYDKKLHETVKNAVEKVNAYLAGINSSYKLETLTDDQINALAGKAFGDDSNPINAQYNAIKALDQDALQNHLAETRIGTAYSEAVSTLVNRLYSAANMEVKSANQQVEATVDTTKTELPKTEEKIPEDKQPTKQDAADKAEALKNELTGDNAAVKDFKDNNLTNTVKVTDLPNVQDDSTVELYVQAQLQDIKLSAAVEKDADGSVTEVKLNSQTLVFDVTPMAKVDDHAAVEVANDLLNGGSVVFRLPIPAEVTEKYAKVAHAGDADRYVEIKTEDGKKYIELSATHFSVFTVSFTNELPQPVQPAQPAAPAQSNDSNASSQSTTTTTAPKQDDSTYYTCKACGYHNWTAVDGGYKCDHCGYVESVKQLAGYPNVKGTATVGKTAAAAKTSAKTMTAIPQTSDDMPVTALAVLAVAALLGLGVTAIAKRKHSK